MLIIIIFIVLYLWAIAPRRNHVFKRGFYAHRGFHDRDGQIPENTLLAFEEAMQRGFGIELDIRFSKDREIYVFHDDDLRRMFNKDLLFRSLESQEIDTLRLNGERIPRLSEVLELVDGKVPLIIEIKESDDYQALVDQSMDLLKDYDGDYAIKSFDPKIIIYLRFKYPKVSRGFLLGQAKIYEKPWKGRVYATLILNFLMRPDFLSVSKRFSKDFLPFKLYEYLGGHLAIWTARKEEEVDRLFVIFEYFEPKV